MKINRFIFARIALIAILVLLFQSEKVQAYNEKSVSVNRNWWFSSLGEGVDWPHPVEAGIYAETFYTLTGMSVSAIHQVGMTEGGYSIAKDSYVRFKYVPELVFNRIGYWQDTPYGFWIGSNEPSCSIAKTYATAYNTSSNYFESDREDVGEVHNVYSLSVFSKNPAVSMQSNNSEIISCTGMNCVAKKGGTARLTAVINSFPTSVFYLVKNSTGGYTICKESSLSPDLSQGTANQLYWDVTVQGAPPSDPVISGPTTGTPNTNYSFSATAADPDGDTIRYNIRRSGETIWRSTIFSASGISQLLGSDFSWPETGVQTFSVQAQDSTGMASGWVTYTINIGNQPPTAPTISGPSIGSINTPYSFNITSIDLDGDGIKYRVFWEGECPIRQVLPNIKNYPVCSGEFSHMWMLTSFSDISYASSGTTQVTSNQWTTAGLKTIHVSARDIYNGTSPESTFTINIGATAPFVCTGSDPNNASLCTSDDQGLPADTAKTLASSCGTAKCEYICNSGYHFDGGNCVQDPSPVLVPSPGQCGEASDKILCQMPLRSELCDSGESYSNFTYADGKWTWKCKGKGGGESVDCSATKDCSWREVNP